MSAEACVFEKVNGGGNIGLCSQLKQRLGYKEEKVGSKVNSAVFIYPLSSPEHDIHQQECHLVSQQPL